MPDIKSKVSARDHLARASVGVPLNIAEASGKRSMNERRQFIDNAYGSSLECAACLDVLCILLADIVRMLAAWERNLEER